MSDDQIRDIVQNAEEWLPDKDGAGDGKDDGGNAGVGTGGAGPPVRPPLQLGSDVEIANCVAQALRQDRGEVIFSEGHFWYYTGSHWRRIEDHQLRLAVHPYDGATIPGSRVPVKLGKTRVDSVLHEMTAILAQPDFFAEAPVGINCASGFIAFTSEGTPSLQPHRPEHRCRHVLKGDWSENWILDAEELFLVYKSVDLLLARLLEGVFLGDTDAEEKRQLLAEIAGAAALGYGTRLLQQKAVILEGKTAENGKSQILDLFRGLLPPGAVASIPAAKMGDERFVVGLVGKHLNAADELSGAEAIASEVFKAVVTGEPVSGRDVYRSAVEFRSMAQNVFATNALPSFKGGMDRGVQRRLLVVTFNRTIPEEERLENIGLRITKEEAGFLLSWAVAGASRLIRQRRFTLPPSSKIALRDWLLSADPVLAWIKACVEEIDPKSTNAETAKIKSADAHAAFMSWAKCEGFRENTLPASNGFVQRLRANLPSIVIKHERDGNYLTGMRITSTSTEGDVEEDFFSGKPW
jgi:P4 family phage/plasmid primase-like protien